MSRERGKSVPVSNPQQKSWLALAYSYIYLFVYSICDGIFDRLSLRERENWEKMWWVRGGWCLSVQNDTSFKTIQYVHSDTKSRKRSKKWREKKATGMKLPRGERLCTHTPPLADKQLQKRLLFYTFLLSHGACLTQVSASKRQQRNLVRDGRSRSVHTCRQRTAEQSRFIFLCKLFLSLDNQII